MLRTWPSCTLAGALALAALASTPAAAVNGAPHIHTPRLYSDPSEFGGLLTVEVGRSDERTAVTACVSNVCKPLHRSSVEPFPSNENVYTATGRDFELVFRRGQRRTVVVVANNGPDYAQWGPTKITVE